LCSFDPSGVAPLMVFPPGASHSKLRRERPANNPVGDHYFEIFFAVDTWNRVTDHLSDSSKDTNMNLLFSLTVLTFNRHHDISLATPDLLREVDPLVQQAWHSFPFRVLLGRARCDRRCVQESTLAQVYGRRAWATGL
jgi:hypothetical protein